MATRDSERARQSDDLSDLLGLRTPPIALAFRDRPPSGIARVAAGEPAGCGYWRLAAEGGTFYTEAGDHQACPIGAHVHNVPLAPGSVTQLNATLEMLEELQYLKPEDVGSIPRLPGVFGVAIYSPLAHAPCPPDVVLLRGNPRQLMLLAEAAQSAGVAPQIPAMGRPTCAAIPAAVNSRRIAASFGCAGNRVYTGAGDDEGYVAVPGAALGRLITHLKTMVAANRKLEAFHRARAQRPSA